MHVKMYNSTNEKAPTTAITVSAHGRINLRLRRIDPTCIKILINVVKDKAYARFVAELQKRAVNAVKIVLVLQIKKHLKGVQLYWRRASALNAQSRILAVAGCALLALKRKARGRLTLCDAAEIAVFVRYVRIHTRRVRADALNIKWLKEQGNFDCAISESRGDNALVAGFISRTSGQFLLATSALFAVAIRRKKSAERLLLSMVTSAPVVASLGFTF